MLRIVPSLLLISITLTACASLTVADLGLQSPSSPERWPREWLSGQERARIFTSVEPSADEAQTEAGSAFLRETVRIDVEALARFADLVLVASGGDGYFGASRFRLAAGKTPGTATLTIERRAPSMSQQVVLDLDMHFRLLHARNRRSIRSSRIETLSEVTCSWQEEKSGYLYVTSANEEEFVKTKTPQVPEEALALLAMLAPPQSMRAKFPIFSTAFRATFDARLYVQPSISTQPNGWTAQVEAWSTSPLGERIQLTMGKVPGVPVFGIQGESMRLYPGAAEDFARVAAMCHLIERERERLYFDGVHIFSALSATGRHLTTPDGALADDALKHSWMSVNLAGLELSLTPPRDGKHNAIATFDRRLAPRQQGEQSIVPHLALVVELDVLAPNLTLEGYASAVEAALASQNKLLAAKRQALRASNRSVSGQAGLRLDFHLIPTGKHRPAELHSLVLLELDGCVLKVSASGDEQSMLDNWKQVEQMFASVVFWGAPRVNPE